MKKNNIQELKEALQKLNSSLKNLEKDTNKLKESIELTLMEADLNNTIS